MKFEQIVHPTDFSKTALDAFRFAVEIAKRQDSALHIIHVYEKPYSIIVLESADSGFALALDPDADKEFQQAINNQLAQLAEPDFAQGVKMYKRLLQDIPAWKFYEELDPDKIDLIVMGTRGATGLLHGGIVGTNAERIIRSAPIPVLSVPEKAQYTNIKRILFATNFQDDLTKVFPKILAFCKLFDAELIVGVINTRDNYATTKYATENYESLLATFPYEKSRLIIRNDDSVQEGITELVDAEKIDLITMLTHGRTGIAHLIYGSIAEDLAKSTDIATPILTFKN